ncbi:MAG: hypothetical protein MJZ17_05000 [Bacteroidales bacterium]|nr:hypothetical protein [Bacteroidales bacterium]
MPNIFKNPATAAITGGVALPFGMDWLQHEDVKVPVVDSVLDMTRGKFDKFRAGNFALNSMIGAASGGLMAKPKTLVQGASLAALAPAKDLLLNMQGTPEKVNKVLDEMPEVTKAMKDAGNRSNILMGILGAGALGIGGAALWKYLKKRDDIPGENGTIQYIMKGKEGDPETDALVTVPINNPAVSQSVAEDMNISVRRGLGKAVKWNSSRRDPNTGKLIPYAVWNNLYGHKDESEPAKAPNSDYDAKSGDNDPKGMNKDAAKKKDKKKGKSRKGGLHSTAGMIGGSTIGALKSMALGGGLIPGALSGAKAGMEVDTLRNLNDSLKPKDRKNGGMITGGILGGLGGGALGALTAPENKAVSVPIGAILGALAGGSTGIDIDSYRASGAVADKISKKRKGKEHSNRFGTTLAGALTGAGLGGLVGSLKRDAMGNAGLGLGAGTGIGAGIGALSGGLLGSKIDEYRNITDANEMLGNGRSHKAPAIGAGAGGLLGAILGGIGAGPGGAVGGALAGAGGGALLGTGVGSYLKSNDIVNEEEEPEKNAAAEGFNAMAYNSGSGAPEGVLKAVNRFTRPAGTERKDDHSYTEGSHNTNSAGLGLNDAGGNAGINKSASEVDPGDMRNRFIGMVGNTMSNAANSAYGAASDAARWTGRQVGNAARSAYGAASKALDWTSSQVGNAVRAMEDADKARVNGQTLSSYRRDRASRQREDLRNTAESVVNRFRAYGTPLTDADRAAIRTNDKMNEFDRLYNAGRQAGTIKAVNYGNRKDVLKDVSDAYDREMGRGPIDAANTRAELGDTGTVKKASREFAEGAGTVSSGLVGGALGGAGGAAVASGLGKDPVIGGTAGALLGALVPNMVGYLAGKTAGPRPDGALEQHDSHADMAEYVVPGYASYQYARRMETEDAAAKAKEDTMKSYLATGAMPGGQDGIPSNLESDDEEEDYGNFKSAAVQGAYPGQQPASSTHPAIRNLNGALNNNRQNANTQNTRQQGQQAGQQMQSQRDYNEQTRIATDMQMYGYARVRGADGKLYHPQQQQGQQAQQGQQQTQQQPQQQQQAGTSGIQVANTTLPAAGGANATSTQNPAPRTGNGNAPLTMNSTPVVVQDNGQRELQSVGEDAANSEYDRRLNMYRQHGYKGDGSDITGLGPRDKFVADYNKRRSEAAPPPMTPEQKAADEAQRASTAATTRSQLRSDIARERTITNMNGTSQTIDSKTTPEQYLMDNMFNNGSSTSSTTGLDANGVYHAKARRINSAGLAETVDMDSDTVDTANLRKSLGDMRNGMQKKLGVDPNSMNFWNLNSRDDYDNAAKWMKEYGAGQDQIDALNKDRTARYGRDSVNSWYLDNDRKVQANSSVGVRNMLSSYGDAGKQSWANLRSPNDYYQARSWLLSNGTATGRTRGDINTALKRLEADYNTRFGNQTEYNPQQ